MSNTLLAWTNYAATGTLTAGSANAVLPVSNWQSDQGAASMAWQTAPGVVTSAAGAYVQIDAGEVVNWSAFGLFRTNLTSSATIRWRTWTFGIGSPGYDSGTLSAGVAAGYGQTLLIGSGMLGQYARVDIDDPSNPDSCINIPLAFAGPVFTPIIGPDWTSVLARDDATDEVVTRGGQEYPVVHWTKRRYEAAWLGIRSSELWPSFMEFDRIARLGGNVLFVPDTTSASTNQEAVFGRARATKDVGYPAKSADARSMSFRVTERL